MPEKEVAILLKYLEKYLLKFVLLQRRIEGLTL